MQHCTIICDTSTACTGALISCPRYTKGTGTCTVICAGDSACGDETLIKGRSVGNLSLECTGSSTCYAAEINHFEPTAKWLQILANGKNSANYLFVNYGGSDKSKTIIRCSLWNESDPLTGHVCRALRIFDSLGAEQSAGKFKLDCRELYSFSHFENVFYSCTPYAELRRTRDAHFLFFVSAWAAEYSRLKVSGAQFLEITNPGNMYVNVESHSVNISLSHGSNEIKIYPTVKKLFVAGDLYEDIYEFMSAEGSTEEAKGPAQYIFTSDVDTPTYWQYRYSHWQGATIKFPGASDNPGVYTSVKFVASKKHTFKDIKITKNEKGGLNEVIFECVGENTCENLKMNPILLLSGGSVKVRC